MFCHKVCIGYQPFRIHYSVNSMDSLPSWNLDDQHSVAPSSEEFAWTKTSSTSKQLVLMTISEVSKHAVN